MTADAPAVTLSPVSWVYERTIADRHQAIEAAFARGLPTVAPDPSPPLTR